MPSTSTQPGGDGRVFTRRTFLTGGAGVGLTVAGSALLGACGAGSTPPHRAMDRPAAGSAPKGTVRGMPVLPVVFAGGDEGPWSVRSASAVVGPALPTVERLAVLEGTRAAPPGATWALLGVVSNERYVERREHEELAARSPRLGRPEATRAALIPIRKSEGWWALSQDERRAIFEERSRHIAIGLKYLPAVARRLHHSRDLGELFDFLTWFEFAPADEAGFDEVVAMLRATEEWAFVEREVDIRLER